ADLEGTTRDPVRGRAAGAGGRTIEWVDLAGFEAPPAAQEDGPGPPAGGEDLPAALARLGRRELEEADVVIWVVDGASPTRERSLAVYRSLRAPRKLLVVQKCDLLDPAAREAWRALPEAPVLASARNALGLEELRD